MLDNRIIIETYSPEYENAVIELWRKCNLLRSWNNAKKDIERKMKVSDKLFLIGFLDNEIIATVMGGYDGHRGYINYLAIDPVYQGRGIGKEIMQAIEERLKALNCPKINVQIRNDNLDTLNFYKSIGYNQDKVVSIGKRLIED